MWRIPLSLFGGGGTINVEFLDDTYIGNLWTYLGSPSDPVDVVITANASDVAEIIVTNDFAAGSTFQFTATNNGRFIGTGGGGGDGGDDNGASGTAGSRGDDGGHAIASDTFSVSIDIDDGFLLGGGGGGGGGSYNDTGAGGTPGGGGGGGAGWGDADGGAAGSPTGSPVAASGIAGSQVSAGAGGAGGTSATNDGGDGADYGYGGNYGQFASPNTGLFGNLDSGNGGSGGNAGSAFYPTNGAVATFSGAKSETTLRTESRIAGEVDGCLALYDINNFTTIITSGSETLGFTFVNNVTGTLRRVNSGSGNVDLTNAYYIGNDITASGYEVRTVLGTGGGDGWGASGAADDTWVAISADRAWSVSATSSEEAASHLFQIRRAGDTGGIAASGFLVAYINYEP